MNKTTAFPAEHRGHDTLEATMAELIWTKEELKRAKDSVIKSWLDSRPLADELAKLQLGLASARNLTSVSNIVIAELESQLEATNSAIRLKMEEELKAALMTIEITCALDETREEHEAIKMENDGERRERLQLKQLLRMRRQSLRTRQLTLRAMRMESEAFRESRAEALSHISSSEIDNKTIKLSEEEYFVLTRSAKEESSLAEWRVSVSMEQKVAAAASRDLALSRLQEILQPQEHRLRRQMRRRRRERIVNEIEEEEEEEEEEEDSSSVGRGAQVNRVLEYEDAGEVRDHRGPDAVGKARDKAIEKSNQPRNPSSKQMRRAANSSKKLGVVSGKKTSIMCRIRRFLARSITKLL